jgi:hypothetical protein
MTKNHVWEFTNQKKLSKKEFISYFERKVFKTIRKYNMLPESKTFKLPQHSTIRGTSSEVLVPGGTPSTATKENTINTKVLKKILETKFPVEFSSKPNISSVNLSDVAETTFENILNGKLTGPKPTDKIKSPLYFHSDKEIELYAKLTNTAGTKRKRNPKIQNLFKKFLNKNQDLELNIIKALGQI